MKDTDVMNAQVHRCLLASLPPRRILHAMHSAAHSRHSRRMQILASAIVGLI